MLHIGQILYDNDPRYSTGRSGSPRTDHLLPLLDD
jgi:hypothetical protein